MSKKSTTLDPLGPLDAITRVLMGVLITFSLLGILVVATGQGSWLGFGENSICRKPNFAIGAETEVPPHMLTTFGLNEGVSVQNAPIEVCQEDPSAIQSAFVALSEAPTYLLFITFLVLARRTIKYARHHGLFSSNLAARVEAIGWLLLLGLVTAAAIEWLADGLLKHSMASTMSWHSGSFGISIASIIGAYGIISVGRVMSRASEMQADLEGTV